MASIVAIASLFATEKLTSYSTRQKRSYHIQFTVRCKKTTKKYRNGIDVSFVLSGLCGVSPTFTQSTVSQTALMHNLIR